MPVDLNYLVLAWIVAAGATVLIRRRMELREVGLVWAYMGNLALIHWPGAVVYALPWYHGSQLNTVYAGFYQSTIALIGFAVGAILLAPALVKAFPAPGTHDNPPPDSLLPRTYMITGAIAYLVISPLAGRIPTVGALATAATQLVIVGICLMCWHGWHTGQFGRWRFALLIAAFFPFITMLGQGFLGYGAAALLMVLAFNGIFVKPRWKVAVFALVVGYLGMSLFVTYMRDRTEIRRAVWGGSTLMDRITSVSGSVREGEWFNPYDDSHLERIDVRLNQNFLVGAAVESMSQGLVKPANGQTVIEAIQGLVPRALWPNKPMRAGSGSVVADYTGMSFAAGTSVGIGQVMEFYINFQTTGVLIGFILLGGLIGMFDAWAGDRLWAGDWQQFCIWFLAGLGFLQAGGALLEVFTTVGAGLLAAVMVNRHLIPLIHSRRARRQAHPARMY